MSKSTISFTKNKPGKSHFKLIGGFLFLAPSARTGYIFPLAAGPRADLFGKQQTYVGLVKILWVSMALTQDLRNLGDEIDGVPLEGVVARQPLGRLFEHAVGRRLKQKGGGGGLWKGKRNRIADFASQSRRNKVASHAMWLLGCLQCPTDLLSSHMKTLRNQGCILIAFQNGETRYCTFKHISDKKRYLYRQLKMRDIFVIRVDGPFFKDLNWDSEAGS